MSEATTMDVDPDFHVPFHCRQLAPSNISGWDYSSVPELVVRRTHSLQSPMLPEGMSPEDASTLTEHLQVLQDAAASLSPSSPPAEIEQFERKLRQLALAWEDYYLPKFPGPFFRVRVADVRAVGGSWSTALTLYDEVLHSLQSPEGASFAEFVSVVRSRAQGDAEQQGSYHLPIPIPHRPCFTARRRSCVHA
ncbi:hypothetical protein ID866_5931, partial [Astraeus odoratus]